MAFAPVGCLQLHSMYIVDVHFDIFVEFFVVFYTIRIILIDSWDIVYLLVESKLM